ncbi:hypothetical protein ECOP18_022 [Escherichia phage ECOP18]|uniref:hypothetical protein n=1 Tax=Escherichia phage ECOP18 TaxID=2713223 RepID=UPI003F4994B3|nr:hypothetical protein ECOP18_022 [Escherichia phage ECOP18]
MVGYAQIIKYSKYQTHRSIKDMSNKRKNRRGEVYEAWINIYGFGFVLFLIFVGFWLAAMAGWI